MINKCILIILFLFYSGKNCFAQSRETSWRDFFIKDTFSNVKYDTLEAVFLYENLILAYIEIDAVVKSESLIKDNPIKEKLYKDGVYTWFTSDFFYQRAGHSNSNFYYDTSSVFSTLGLLDYYSIQDGTKWQKTGINPFCGVFYKWFQMKIEVIYFGEIKQRIPLLLNCNELDKYKIDNNGRNYKIQAVPTYLITRVFEFQEL